MDFEDIVHKSGGGTCEAKAEQVISLGDDRSRFFLPSVYTSILNRDREHARKKRGFFLCLEFSFMDTKIIFMDILS